MRTTGTTREVGERRLLALLPTIERIVGKAAGRYRLKATDRQELESAVLVRLVEDDYAVLRQFRGASQWSTYLTVVVHRVLLDQRSAAWGRWRPSAQARRLGPVAVALERCIERDGFTITEAVRTLTATRSHETASDLAHLAEMLPPRAAPPRRVEVRDEERLARAAGEERADRRVKRVERARVAARVGKILEVALRELSVEDRGLLALRFRRGWTVRRIAANENVAARPLYRRLSGVLRRLRRRLESAGLGWREVAESLGAREIDFEIDAL